MQNQYVGDIGDFGKFGLLRNLAQSTGLRFGVNWYFVGPQGSREVQNSDGGHIAYLLKGDSCREYDPILFDKLYSIVKPEESGTRVVSRGQREVSALEKAEILSRGTVFYSKILDLSLGGRDQWVENGLDALKDCEIVFFDPDNGFPPIKNCDFDVSAPKTSKKSMKYAYHEELIRYFERGQSLIVYQHRTREKEEKYGWRFQKIKKIIPGKKEILYVRFHWTSGRDYVFILQPKHKQVMEVALRSFLEGRWGKKGIFSEVCYV